MDELQRLCAPDPDLDRLAAVRMLPTEFFRRMARQVIREHHAREADPKLRRRVEGGMGRPRKAGSWLELNLALVLESAGIPAAARFSAIAEVVTAITRSPTSARAVRNRITAAHHAARRDPRKPGPPVHPSLGTTDRADAIRQGIADQRESRARLRRS